MPTEEKFNIEDQLEGGTGPSQMYIPPPPVLHLTSTQEPELEGYELGEEFVFTVHARITSIDEEGNYSLEMSDIEIPSKATQLDKAKEEVEGPLGVLSNESLTELLGDK